MKHEGYIPDQETQEPWRARWEAEKQNKGEQRAAAVIKRGRELNVPEQEIEKFFDDIVQKRMQSDPYFAWRFARFIGIGSEEKLNALRRQAFEVALHNGNAEDARAIARGEWGENSPEYQQAQELELSGDIALSREATFADLLNTVGEEKFITLWRMANGYAPHDALQRIDELLKHDRDALYGVNILSFFSAYTYGEDDFREYLGILFED